MVKLIRNILGLVGALVIVVFSVANRTLVDVSFFPLPMEPIELPVFGVFLIGIFLGAVLGGLSVWLSTHPMRVEWRRLRRRFRALEQQQRVKQQQEEEAAAERSRQRAERQQLAIAAPRS